jgi:hypothetical protein
MLICETRKPRSTGGSSRYRKALSRCKIAIGVLDGKQDEDFLAADKAKATIEFLPSSGASGTLELTADNS